MKPKLKSASRRTSQKRGILCGTDFSVHANEAADAAAVLAKQLGEKLTLVHVREFATFGVAPSRAFAAGARKVRSSLENETARLAADDLHVAGKILSGSPHQAIVQEAIASNARCLVVASLGRVALSRLLIGSVAERVAETAPVPTLVVRGASAWQAWADGRRPLRILVGHDFSATADTALTWTHALAQLGACEVTVAHVGWPPTPRNHSNRKLERTLKTRTASVFKGEAVSFRVVTNWGRPDAALIDLAQKERVDLIVVGTHQRHGLGRFWLGSVSRYVLRHAPMSVAVVPTK